MPLFHSTGGQPPQIFAKDRDRVITNGPDPRTNPIPKMQAAPNKPLGNGPMPR